MPTLRMESSTEAKSESTPVKPAGGVPGLQNQTKEIPGLGSIVTVRKEIDDVMADMGDFYRAEPDMVMSAVSAHGARLVEIIVRITRIEVIMREWKPVREEAEKVLNELKSQFQVASRQVAIRQMDLQLSGGQT